MNIRLLLLFLIPFSLFAQQKEVALNSNTIFKDSSGKRISFERFIELTEVPDCILDPLFNAEGELIEMYVVYPQNVEGDYKMVEEAAPLKPKLLDYGEVTAFEKYRGKVLVLNFWFTSCGPCIQEIPVLNELKKEFDGQEVAFVAPTFEKHDKAMAFKEKHEFLYEVMPESRAIINKLNVFGFPTHMVFDRDGQLLETLTGSHNIKNRIRELIITLE